MEAKEWLAHTPKREDGIYVGSPYDLFGSKHKKSFFEAKGRAQDSQLPIQAGLPIPLLHN